MVFYECPQPGPVPVHGTGMPRVLVTAPEKELRAELTRHLESAGFLVDDASGVPAALAHAASGEYAALVAHSPLGALSGPEICGTLRRGGILTPVLLLSPEGGARHEADALDAGADDFLVTPCSPRVLVSRLCALVRRQNLSYAAVYTFGDLRIAPASLSCSRGGQPIALTARESAVLGYLARHAGRAVAKSDIASYVCDRAHDGGGNLIEVYVGRLRQKVDVPFGRRAIRTVRGAGYLLREDGG